MGLLDFLSGGGQSNGAASQGFGTYGGVPLGIRLIAAGQAMSNLASPGSGGQGGLALLGRFKEQAAEDKKAAALLAKKQEIAARLADKLEPSNPELAQSIRDNPDLVDEYVKGSITSNFEAAQHTRDRTEKLTDQKTQWGHEDIVKAGDRKYQEGLTADKNLREDTQKAADRLNANANTTSQQMLTVKQKEADRAFELRKIKDQRDADEALRNGNKAEAQRINTRFFNETGQVLDNPAAVPGMPSQGRYGTPQTDVPPQAQPGMPPQGAAPQQDDPYHTAKWQEQFGDSTITKPEAARMTSAFRAALNPNDPKKRPTEEEAIDMARKVYETVIKERTDKTVADAATSEANTKAAAAGIKGRIENAATADTAVAGADYAVEGAKVVQKAYGDIQKAITADKQLSAQGAWHLPATGMGSGIASWISESNSRAAWNATEAIKNRIGLDTLQTMRDMSQNGSSGLGQLAIQEMEQLKKAAGALDPTDINFEENLKIVYDKYMKQMEHNSHISEDITNLRNNPTPEYKDAFDEIYGKDAHIKFVGE